MGQARNRKASGALSTQDWALAALDEMADRGIDAVAVEALARKLGVTKGSFYWHFNNRDNLIRAALTEWEARETDVLLARARTEAEPAQRIRRLISEVNASRRASRLYLALSTASRPVFVRACVERVAARRFEFLRTCYLDLEHDEHAAHDWALMTFSVFLGSLQARHDIPGEWPAADSAAFTRYVGFLMDQLIPATAPATTRTPDSATIP